jgi:hypothetical protein
LGLGMRLGRVKNWASGGKTGRGEIMEKKTRRVRKEEAGPRLG